MPLTLSSVTKSSTDAWDILEAAKLEGWSNSFTFIDFTIDPARYSTYELTFQAMDWNPSQNNNNAHWSATYLRFITRNGVDAGSNYRCSNWYAGSGFLSTTPTPSTSPSYGHHRGDVPSIWLGAGDGWQWNGQGKALITIPANDADNYAAVRAWSGIHVSSGVTPAWPASASDSGAYYMDGSGVYLGDYARSITGFRLYGTGVGPTARFAYKLRGLRK